MAHDIAQLILKHAPKFLEREEALRAAVSTGMSKQEAVERVAESFAAREESESEPASPLAMQFAVAQPQADLAHGMMASAAG